jgi:hypothetical protein
MTASAAEVCFLIVILDTSDVQSTPQRLEAAPYREV